LNSCAGAVTGTTDLFSSTAAALVQGGVSAVAAMQYEISGPAATAFARGFYGAIAHGREVDDAVSSGRAAIIGTGVRTLEWDPPVLYLRGQDARLFTVESTALPQAPILCSPGRDQASPSDPAGRVQASNASPPPAPGTDGTAAIPPAGATAAPPRSRR